MNSCKTAVVWVFFLLFRGPGHETFSWLQFIGFIILILGTLIFNEIIVIPLFGFNKKLRKHEKDLEEEKQRLLYEESNQNRKMMSCISSTSLEASPIAGKLNETLSRSSYTNASSR